MWLRAGGVTLAGLLLASGASGQEWRLSSQVGRLTWPGTAVATSQEQTSLAVGLSRIGPGTWLALSGGAPVSSGTDPGYWGAVGGGTRLTMDSPAGLGADIAAQTFVQRLPGHAPTPRLPGVPPPMSSAETVDGGSVQAMALAFARLGEIRAEGRGGVAFTRLRLRGETEQEFVPLTDARVLAHVGPLQVGGEAQHWHRRATYAGATALVATQRGAVWGSAGSWTHGGPDGVSWGAGALVNLPYGLRIDASLRENGFDPLYDRPTGRSTSLGVSVRLGGGARYSAPVPAQYENGTAVIRLRARDARGTPRIAGDFTDWKPVPMTPQGDAWVLAVPLQPGVYHYAFVTEDGEWFVPASTPGRRDDGMGGHVAVLIVEA